MRTTIEYRIVQNGRQAGADVGVRDKGRRQLAGVNSEVAVTRGGGSLPIADAIARLTAKSATASHVHMTCTIGKHVQAIHDTPGLDTREGEDCVAKMNCSQKLVTEAC